MFGECLFDAEGCKEGIEHLELYSKSWVQKTATWSDDPLKDEHTEAADSFMQFAQSYGTLNNTGKAIAPNRKRLRRR